MPTISLDPTQAGVQITRDGFGWGPIGSPAGPITYGFRSSSPGYETYYYDALGRLHAEGLQTTFTQFNSTQIDAANLAIQLWGDVANISFSRVGSGDSGPSAYTNNATILFGNYSNGFDGAAAFSYYATQGQTASSDQAGDVWMNAYYGVNTSPAVGNYGFLTILHELGHGAIGLEHPGDYNAAPGVPITYANNAEYIEDTRQYTVMSYFEASNTGANHVYNGVTIYASTPLLDDIAAAQRLYGPNMTTRTGDTVYGFNSNADRSVFHLTNATDQVVFAVWDAGGNDTFDFSGYDDNQFINLNPGAFSDVGALTGNVAIALNVIIENAIGGGGNDVIVGNTADNMLSGGNGNDTELGGDGADVLYGGAGNDFLQGNDGNDQLYGGDGSDVLDGGSGGNWLSGGNGADVLVGGSGNDTLYGDDGNDTIFGNEDNDYLSGGTGDDYLDGGAGDDVIDAGPGNDTAVGGDGNDVMFGFGGNDVLVGQNGDDQIYGGDNDDTIIGDNGGGSGSGDDRLFGEQGNDFLEGDGGNDQLYGGDGNDVLDGGTGNDVLYGGNGDDVAVGGDGNDLIFGDAGNDTLIGSNGDDFISGEDGNDFLDGGNGNDTLYGGNGDDVIDTGAGVNVAYGGLGNDVIVGRDSANTLSGDDGDDTMIGGTGNDTLYGGSGNDYVDAGTAGNDVLFGGDGNDTLQTSGVGNDSLYGGAGTDLAAVLENGNVSHVDIWDFLIGPEHDVLDIQLRDGITVALVTDNGIDTTIAFSDGDAVVLHGVTGGGTPFASLPDIDQLSQQQASYDLVFFG